MNLLLRYILFVLGPVYAFADDTLCNTETVTDVKKEDSIEMNRDSLKKSLKVYLSNEEFSSSEIGLIVGPEIRRMLSNEIPFLFMEEFSGSSSIGANLIVKTNCDVTHLQNDYPNLKSVAVVDEAIWAFLSEIAHPLRMGATNVRNARDESDLTVIYFYDGSEIWLASFSNPWRAKFQNHQGEFVFPPDGGQYTDSDIREYIVNSRVVMLADLIDNLLGGTTFLKSRYAGIQLEIDAASGTEKGD